MASRLMLSRVPLPAENVHRARGEAIDSAKSAAEYEKTLRDFFGLDASATPVFDLVVLGMGEDGHTASLFPGSDGWRESKRLVVAHDVVKRGERVRRLTMTNRVLTAARQLLFLVAGISKSEMLASVLEGEAPVPAREVDLAARERVWIVDHNAASLLTDAAPVARGGR
jgi:6-phosphogluconolactonase